MSDTYEDYCLRNESIGKENLKKVCEILKTHGVTSIEAPYDGSGDEGCVDDVYLFDASHKGIDFPDEEVTISQFSYATDTASKISLSLEEALLDCVYLILPGGWEIDSGSLGVLKIDVLTGKYTIEHNWRVEETEYEEFNGDLA